MAKKFMTFKVRRSQDTNVCMRFDDKDYDPESEEDMVLLARRACYCVELDLKRDTKSYAFGNQVLEVIGDRPRPQAQCTEYSAQLMPRPNGWFEKRVRAALDGYIDPLEASSPGCRFRLDIAGDGFTVLRVIFWAAAGDGRGFIDGGALKLGDMISVDGDLVSHFTGDTSSKILELTNMVRSALNPQWSDSETWDRFKAAFDWNEDGKVKS